MHFSFEDNYMGCTFCILKVCKHEPQKGFKVKAKEQATLKIKLLLLSPAPPST